MKVLEFLLNVKIPLKFCQAVLTTRYSYHLKFFLLKSLTKKNSYSLEEDRQHQPTSHTNTKSGYKAQAKAACFL